MKTIVDVSSRLKQVVLKVLPQAFAAEPGRLRHFTLEARSAGALNQPRIPAICGIGTYEGLPYIVSESLGARLKLGRLSGTKTVKPGRQVAPAKPAPPDARRHALRRDPRGLPLPGSADVHSGDSHG